MKTNKDITVMDEFEKAYMASKEYESLLAKPDKTQKETERMNRLYEALRIEAPYLLDFFDL